MLKKEGIKTKEGAKKVMGEVTSKAIAATPMAKEFVAGLNAKAKENFDKAHPPRPQKVAGAVDPSTPVVASEPAPTPAPAPAVEQAVPVAVSSEPAPVAATEAAPAASTSVSTATETRADDPETKESATAKISALFSESAMLIYESDEMNYSTKYKSQDDLRKLLKRVKRGLNRGVSPSDSIKEFKLGAEAIVNEYTNSGHTTKASPYETVPTRRDAISESATELAAVVEAGAAQDAQVPSEDAGVTTEKEVLSVDDLPLVGTVTDTKWKPSTATAASVKPEAVVASSAG